MYPHRPIYAAIDSGRRPQSDTYYDLPSTKGAPECLGLDACTASLDTPCLEACAPLVHTETAGRAERDDAEPTRLLALVRHHGAVVGPVAVVEEEHLVKADARRLPQPYLARAEAAARFG